MKRAEKQFNRQNLNLSSVYSLNLSAIKYIPFFFTKLTKYFRVKKTLKIICLNNS
jgi:hypothetical protein